MKMATAFKKIIEPASETNNMETGIPSVLGIRTDEYVLSFLLVSVNARQLKFPGFCLIGFDRDVSCLGTIKINNLTIIGPDIGYY